MNDSESTFDSQLRQLMPSVDKRDDRLAVFRRYLQDGYLGDDLKTDGDRLVRAGEQIEKWKVTGIPEGHFRFGVATEFPLWRKKHIAKIRRNAAASRKKVSLPRKKPLASRN